MSDAMFVGKSAIVTGGASGIGRALAAGLARRGASVVVTDVDGDAAERVAKELDGASADATVAGSELDVRDRDGFARLVADTVDTHGRIDYLFNNAGISLGGETHHMTGAHWDRIIDINLGGVINGLLAAYPTMVRQGHGHIVNTASAAGLAPTLLTVGYATTKHAVVGLSTSLRVEAATHGVRVSVLCPGAIDTPILDKEMPEDLAPILGPQLTARQFLERLRFTPMPADDFAHKALERVARDQAVIVVPATAKALWWGQRLSPALGDRIRARLLPRLLRP